jgi:hypothetical protein
VNDSQRATLAAYCQKYPALAPVAHHEAAHVVVACDCGRRIAAASIDAVRENLGIVEYAAVSGPVDSWRFHWVTMKIAAAGPVGQLKFFPASDDPTSDWSDASDMSILLRSAMSILGLRKRRVARANRLIDHAFKAANILVERHVDSIELVALRLFEFHETLLRVRS